MIKLKRIVSILIFISILLTMLSCASSNKETAQKPVPATPKFAGATSVAPLESNSSMDAALTGYTDRKIVRTGSLTIEVNDISKAIDEIGIIATQYGGYVVNSSQSANSDIPTGSISIRVPADKFNDALQKLRGLAMKVIYEGTNSQDVTEQYTDLKAQLANYEATEAQYLELLKKAENVKDILEVQKELANVRGNIERIKGRMLYLERTSETSLIDVNLQKARPIGESQWDIAGIFKSAVDGLIIFGKALLAIIIWLVVFSPLWIVVIVIVMVVRRKRKNKAISSQK